MTIKQQKRDEVVTLRRDRDGATTTIRMTSESATAYYGKPIEGDGRVVYVKVNWKPVKR